MSKYEIVYGPYFLVFGLNTGKYGQKKSLYGLFWRSVIELEEKSRRNNFRIDGIKEEPNETWEALKKTQNIITDKSEKESNEEIGMSWNRAS